MLLLGARVVKWVDDEAPPAEENTPPSSLPRRGKHALAAGHEARAEVDLALYLLVQRHYDN
jgi:hypothetical protein